MNLQRGSSVWIGLVSVSPFAYAVWLVVADNLGVDPAKKLALFTGEWSLIFLLLVLLISPVVRRFPSAKFLMAYRRQLGLWTFFYATLHLLVFEIMYLGLDLSLLWSELQERPYISVGGLAWFLLLPLALTSNRLAVRKLGGRGWKNLHRLAYPALLLGLVHLIWQVRAGWLEAAIYSLIGCLLLLERWYFRRPERA